jgi:hypothetical protein
MQALRSSEVAGHVVLVRLSDDPSLHPYVGRPLMIGPPAHHPFVGAKPGYTIVVDGHMVICKCPETLERIAELLNRHGLVDAADDDMPPDPFIVADAWVLTPVPPRPWWVRWVETWTRKP